MRLSMSVMSGSCADDVGPGFFPVLRKRPDAIRARRFRAAMILQVTPHMFGDVIGAIGRFVEGYVGEVVQVLQPTSRSRPVRPARLSRSEAGPLKTSISSGRWLGSGAGLHLRRSVLLQFVEERLQADTEDFGGARFVVARVLERKLDEQPSPLRPRWCQPAAAPHPAPTSGCEGRAPAGTPKSRGR